MAQEIGIVKIVNGSVTALAVDGSRRILQAGDRVFADEVLLTDAGGSIIIDANDGSSIDLGHSDQLNLAEALQDAQPAIDVVDTSAAEQSAAQIQQALLAGADPTQVAEATAAGAGAGAVGGGGAGNEGHAAVSVDYLNPVAPVTNGFETTGPAINFSFVQEEPLILNPQPAAPAAAIEENNNPVPIARDDTETLKFGEFLVDSVISNFGDSTGDDSPGTDGFGSPILTNVSFGSQTQSFIGLPANSVLTFETDNGWLDIRSNGSYTYESKNNTSAANPLDQFSYQIQDSTGDVASALLTISQGAGLSNTGLQDQTV